LGEIKEFLAVMREARDDLKAEKNAERTLNERNDEEKVRIGRDLMEAAKERKKRLTPEYNSVDPGV